MKVKKKYFCLVLLFPFFIDAQILLIDKSDSSYLINEKTLSANGKFCQIINYLSREYISVGGHSIRPLILIKVFSYNNKKITSINKPIRILNFKDYVTNNVIPMLNDDISLRIDNLESRFRGSNINQFDSLIFYDGKNYRYMPGVILVEFFNLIDFDQLHPLQTNQTILNTKSRVVQIYSWVQDSLPVPDVDAMLGGKIFLLKRYRDEYVFFRWPFDCSDCPLTFYNEYVYKKDYGIIAFKSKYLFFNNSEFALEKISESNEYYYFK